MSSIRSPITTRTRYNYTRSLTRIIFIARVNVKMAATRKAVEEFSPISPQGREYGTFPLLFFLEMIHISLKGLFICRGHECRCELFIYLFIYLITFPKNLYTWECIKHPTCTSLYTNTKQSKLRNTTSQPHSQ